MNHAKRLVLVLACGVSAGIAVAGASTYSALTRNATPIARGRVQRPIETSFRAGIELGAINTIQGVLVVAFADIMTKDLDQNLVWWVGVRGVIADQDQADRTVYGRFIYDEQWFRAAAPSDQTFVFVEEFPLPPGDYVFTVGLSEQRFDAITGGAT